MKIAFRVDSSPLIGAGHFMRCFALAEVLADQGHNCLFISDEILPGHREKLAKASMEFCQIDCKLDQEAGETLAVINANRCDALVLDHYEVHADWETRILPAVEKMAVIDDLVRKHVDGILIIDPTLGRQATEYSPSDPFAALCGSDYALLAKRYYALREARLGEEQNVRKNLLICYGGSLAFDLTLRTLVALEKKHTISFDQIDVVLPGNAEHLAPIMDICQKMGARFHDWVDDMPSMLANCTHAIGAPGGMAWERCVLGIPSVVVQIADNQSDNLAALVKAKVVERCPMDSIETQLPLALQRLDDNYGAMQRAALALVDGLGARRIAQYFSQDQLRDGSSVILRKATAEDIRPVFDWQCEPDARRFALNPEPPTWNEHQVWMQDRLTRTTTYFHIIEYQGVSVGFVRLDRILKKRYLISILISEKYKKLGIAGLALRRVDELQPEVTICATVLPENLASIALFLKSGYRQMSSQEYVREQIQ